MTTWRHPAEVLNASSATGVPAAVIEAIMLTESSGDSSTSPAGAMGPMQVMPFHFTAGQNPFDLQTNITVGAQVLADGFAKFGNWDSAAATYFGAVDSSGNPTSSTDAGGTTGTAYVQRFESMLSSLGGLHATPDGTTPPAAVAGGTFGGPVAVLVAAVAAAFLLLVD